MIFTDFNRVQQMLQSSTAYCMIFCSSQYIRLFEACPQQSVEEVRSVVCYHYYPEGGDGRHYDRSTPSHDTPQGCDTVSSEGGVWYCVGVVRQPAAVMCYDKSDMPPGHCNCTGTCLSCSDFQQGNLPILIHDCSAVLVLHILWLYGVQIGSRLL